MPETITNPEEIKNIIGSASVTKDSGNEMTAKIESNYKSDPENFEPGVLNPQPPVTEAEKPAEDESAWKKEIPEQFQADTKEETLAKINAAYKELSESNSKVQEKLKELDKPKLTPGKVETAQDAFGKLIGEALETNDVDWQGMRERFFKYQPLTDSDKSRLEKAGISPAMFENNLLKERTDAALEYKKEQEIKTVPAPKEKAELTAEENQQILKEFSEGNVNNFKTMVSWGQANFGQDKMNGIQAAIDTGDVNIARAAIGGLHTAYVASQGQEKPLSVTGGQPSSYTQGVVDAAEATKIFNDPRYRSRRPEDVAWKKAQFRRQWL